MAAVEEASRVIMAGRKKAGPTGATVKHDPTSRTKNLQVLFQVLTRFRRIPP